jgi:predicted flap endonuclease-1-like 5' DNA nuclease/DNA repair exonuclease SbcCD ATPase subunit
MYLLSQLWTYLLMACGVGALLGALCYQLCRRGQMQDELRSLRLTADTETATLRNRLADVDAQRTQAVERLTLLDTQFETLRTSSERSLESFAERIRDLEANLHGREAQFRSAEARVGSEATAHAQTRGRLQEITEELRRVESAHASAAQERDQLKAELEALHGDISGARGMVHEINEAAKSREQVLHREIVDLRSRLADANQSEQALRSELAGLAERQGQRDTELEGLHQQLAEAQSRLSTVSESEKAAQAMVEELAAAKDAIAASEQRQRSADAERATLREQLDDIAAKYQQAMKSETLLRRQVDEHAQRQSTSGAELEALRAELNAAKGSIDGLRQREQAMGPEHADLRNQLVELSARLKDAGASESRLRDDLQRFTQRDVATSDELAKARKELDDLRNTIRIARSREETLLAEISEMRGRASTDRAEIERLAAELKVGREVTEQPSNRNFKPSIIASMDADRLEQLVLAAGDGCKPSNTVGLESSDHDDLKEIGGIGPVNEKWLHDQGIFYFWQIASWVPEELAWVSQNLPNFGKRVYRENWVAQAMQLARGEMTDAKRKYKEGKHR